MCKEGWLVQLGQEDCARVGGTVWNTWKGVGHKRGEGKQRFLKGEGQAGSRGGCLKKKGGGGNLLWTMGSKRNTQESLIYAKTDDCIHCKLRIFPLFFKET